MIALFHQVSAPDLSRADLWEGLVLKAREPMRFVPAIAACRILEEHALGFVREILLRGELVRERVQLDPGRSVLFERLSGHARGTIANHIVEAERGDLALRFEFALEVPGLAPGGIEEDAYAARLLDAYRSAVDSTLREIGRRHLQKLARAMVSVLLVGALFATGGCAAVRGDSPPPATVTGASAASVAYASDPTGPADPSMDLDRAIQRHDDAVLDRLAAEHAAALAEVTESPCDRLVRVRGLGRASWHLAGDLKADAMVAPAGSVLDALIERRVAVARRALPWLERALADAPNDAELLLYRGELLAYSITGFLSALQVGSSSRSDLELAVAQGAGPGAELALAKRFFHLPDAAGGDLSRAAAGVEALLARAPDFALGWTFLGVVRHVQAERDAARVALERSCELDPHGRTASYLLAHPGAVVRR